jgi:hypothetical protein
VQKVPAVYVPRSVQQAVDLILIIAASQDGYREGRDKDGDWNNDTMFGVWYGMNFASWCAIFVSWCSSVAGFSKIIPKHAYTPDGFNWFASRGLADGRRPPNRKGVAATGRGKPRAGDIMYVYSASQGRIHHVGIVEQVLSDGSIKTIEGNTDPGGSAQGTGVFRLTRQVSSRLYFCHPQYAAVVDTTPAKPPAKPGTVTPPKEEDHPMAGLTEADQNVLTAAMTEALKAVVPATERLYVNADNRYEAQAESYFVSAQAYAAIRMAELLQGGTEPREAMDAVRLEVVPFLSPLWATPAKK